MTTSNPPPAIAYFVTSHGYGHAARSTAIMAALQKINPALQFHIFTQTPRYFLEDSLTGPFTYHTLMTDIGVAQQSSLTEDLAETVRRLNDFLPFAPAHLDRLAQQLTQRHCRLVICDISPLGIAVAKAAHLPSLLVENFTWDWIYEGYLPREAGLGRHIAYLQSHFSAADYRLQTEPVCHRTPADLVITTPISRAFRSSIAKTRQQLGLPSGVKLVMITMGGILEQYSFLEQLKQISGIYFVIPGPVEQPQQQHNLFLLPHHSPFFHPDLINAADAVIGKVGYSTIAEVYQAGVPFGYVARPKFPESEFLVAYIEAKLPGLPLAKTDFMTGRWLSRLPELLAIPRVKRSGPNGAEQAARFVWERVLGEG